MKGGDMTQYSEAVKKLTKELCEAKNEIMSTAYRAGKAIDQAIVEIREGEDRLEVADLDKRAAIEFIDELKVKLAEKPEAMNKLTDAVGVG
jgi:hypothetical protein